MEGEFEKLIIEAQDVGQVDKEKNSKQLARHIQIQIAGLRTTLSRKGTKMMWLTLNFQCHAKI